MKRIALSKKTRFEVFKRDNFTCQYCGSCPPKAILHVDHINAVANGGSNDMGNLITACSCCNLGKSANPLTSVPQGLREAAEIVEEREAQIKGYEKMLRRKRMRIDKEAWLVAEIYMNHFALDSIQETDLRSIRLFVEKIGLGACLDAINYAVSKGYSRNRCFKYFCGICWRVSRGE